MMTREELAAMTDDEILAHYRNKHGDPYGRRAREWTGAAARGRPVVGVLEPRSGSYSGVAAP